MDESDTSLIGLISTGTESELMIWSQARERESSREVLGKGSGESIVLVRACNILLGWTVTTGRLSIMYSENSGKRSISGLCESMVLVKAFDILLSVLVTAH